MSIQRTRVRCRPSAYDTGEVEVREVCVGCGGSHVFRCTTSGLCSSDSRWSDQSINRATGILDDAID
ncbi:hypothetical protein F0U59_13370 [Archangium gephyra]|nr:hypothetical protein F0U59_13370 [Archangium gephyra]